MSSVDLSMAGLASGFDWKTLIQQLAQAERAPETALQTQQANLNAQNVAYGTIKTQLGVLQNAVNTLNDPTLYTSRSSQVSNTSVASATAASNAILGSFSFNITQLATAAKRIGTSNIGSPLSTTSDVSGVNLASGGFSTPVTAGTFTVNGQQVTVGATDTLQTVFNNIATATGNNVTASYDPTTDKITLTSASGPVLLGSATDTSNFLQVAKLGNNNTNNVTSSAALGGVPLAATLDAANLATPISPDGAGSFMINGVTINYDSTQDSVQNVLDRINNSSAGVTASYDSLNDRFVLSSQTTGDMDIAMQDVSGNFLAATGLAASTLSRGNNLLYTVDNGSQLSSQSNTITSDSSGIPGLSVTALQTGTTTVTVGSNTSAVSSAITSFISAYNAAQSAISTATASSTDTNGNVTAGPLANDSDADGIAGSLRADVFSPIAGLSTALNHLADLGISTNGNDNTLAITNQSQLDTALATNLQGVASLFTDSKNGIATTLTTYLNATIGDSGSLVTKQNDLTKQSSDIDTQVANLEKVVQADSARWTTEFTAMETAEAQINQQLQYLSKQFG